MILLYIPGWSLFFYPYLFLWCFLRFFFFIILSLKLDFILFDIFMIYLPRNVSFFINHYINAVNNSSKSFIVALICFAVWRITKKNAFICSRFKLAKVFIYLSDVVFASKIFDVFNCGNLTIPKFMRSLSAIYPDVCLVENSNCNKCGFTQKVAGLPDSSSIA